MARKSIKEGIKKILNDYGDEITERKETAAHNENFSNALIWQDAEGLFFEMQRKIYDVGGIELEINCPKCNCPNLLDLRELDDLTKPDIEAVICWNCRHKWLLAGVEDWTSLDEANTVFGKNVIESLKEEIRDLKARLDYMRNVSKAKV